MSLGSRTSLLSCRSILLDPETYNKQRSANFQDAMAGIDAASSIEGKVGDAHIHVTTVLTKK